MFFDVFFCIRDQHDIRLVLLAAAVCLLSLATGVLMIRHAKIAQGNIADRWAVAGGFATGFGIWATHFIAMLGYDPGFITGYRVGLTLGSLAIVGTSTSLAFLLATTRRTPLHFAIASFIAGGGFATMHYIGVAALEMPALIQWNIPYVLLSVGLAVVPLYPAITLAVNGRRLGSGAAAAGIGSLAVIGLHFTGMTAIELLPSAIEPGAALISHRLMSILIGGASLALMALCFLTWLVSRNTRAALAQSERTFSMLVKGISDCAIYMLDASGRVANWNTGAEQLKGYTATDIVGQPFTRFYTAEDRLAGLPDKAMQTARSTGKFTGEGWRVRKNGEKFWAHVVIERMQDEQGHIIGYAKITREMTRFKEDQDRIEQARLHLNTALEHMHQGLCLFDANHRLVLRNRRFIELWNLPDDSCLPGWSLTEITRAALTARSGAPVSEERLESAMALLQQSFADPSMPPLISEFGEDFVVAISSRQLPDKGWVTTLEDITERRQSEAQIAHMALHDALTGLPNRTSFNNWLDKEIAIADASNQQVALVAIDLDRFKEINDSQGHAAGDLVLKNIAENLANILDEGEIAARLGGDEFAVARQIGDPAELTDFISRIADCFNNSIGSHDGIPVGASLGIAIYPADADGREALLNNADLAMYRAKRDLSENICYYEPGMDESARRRRVLANDLRQAIERNELTLLYQPQRSLRTNSLLGYEALLRWHHPRLGLISPVEFIPIAEETGEIMRLGEWVLRASCEEAVRWPTEGRVAVNLSPVQLLQPNLPEIVTEILVETGLPARRLELEITETALIADKVRALHSLRRIKALGVLVAMDDFGTGYSSLDTLHSFPFDKIKIDKSFLLKSQSSDQAVAIIRAVLALGKSLSIPVLAEGVETEQQLDLLIDEGCDEAQGYYFGHPSAAPSLADTDQAVA